MNCPWSSVLTVGSGFQARRDVNARNGISGSSLSDQARDPNGAFQGDHDVRGPVCLDPEALLIRDVPGRCDIGLAVDKQRPLGELWNLEASEPVRAHGPHRGGRRALSNSRW